MMQAYTHSIETFGSVDGPGIRFVLFLQGCALKCKYCHNRDSWNMKSGKIKTVNEILNEILKYKEFFDASGGGVTVSGGEPLLQVPFITELFKECKKHGIHTNIDTSGDIKLTQENVSLLKNLFKVTDLLMLDVKLMNTDDHKNLTGKTNEHILEFGRFVSSENVPMWIRRTLIPGLTDDETDLKELSKYLSELNNVKKVEVLPYHMMGKYKWEQMGLEYPLETEIPPTTEQVQYAQEILNKGLKKENI